jgi:tetratricopeptide (TPR) repeat protein
MNTGTKTPLFKSRLVSAMFLCLLAVMTGCAPHSNVQTFEVPVSPKADASYNFLVYQDYLTQFEKELRTGGNSKAKLEKIKSLQLHALEYIDKVLAKDQRPFLYAEKAALYWTLNQIPESREVIKAGLEKYPDNQRLTLSLASTYLNENRFEAAQVTLKSYLKKNPHDYNVRNKLAQIYIEQKNFAHALDILKTIPAGHRTPEILYSYAKASAGLGLNRQAIRTLKKAVKKAPGFIEAWGELAYLYEYQKDYDAAEKIYTHMLEMGGAPTDVRQRLISLSLKLNNPDRALSLVLEGPHTKSFIFEAVRAFMHNDFYAQASTILDILAQRKPIPTDYFFYKGAIAYEGEQAPEKALEYLSRIPEDSVHYNQSLEFRAHLLFSLNRKTDALEILRLGQKKFPDNPEFYIMEASIFMDSEDHSTAENIIRNGLKAVPGNTRLMFQLGVVLDAEGNTDEAIKIMERIISKNPDHANALNFVGYTLADRNTQLDRALVLISRADKLEPDNPFIMDSLAWVYFRMGKKNKAWDEIKRAVSMLDKEAELWEHYGDIARSLGKKKSARKGYLNALKYGSDNMNEIRKKLNSL